MNEDNNVFSKSPASSYFLTEEEGLQTSWYTTRVKPFLNVLRYFFVQIWPAVNRTINAVVEFSIRLVKGVISIAIDQIKNFRGG